MRKIKFEFRNPRDAEKMFEVPHKLGFGLYTDYSFVKKMPLSERIKYAISIITAGKLFT